MSKNYHRVRYKSHYPEAKKAIEQKLVPRMLAHVLLYIEQQSKLILTDNGRVDTGFLRNSGYLMGLGLDNYDSRTWADGEHKSGKTGKDVGRTKAPAQQPSGPNRVIFGYAASYAFWIEQLDGFLMRAVNMAKDKYSGHARIEVKTL